MDKDILYGLIDDDDEMTDEEKREAYFAEIADDEYEHERECTR
jgi:hypothetical protein